MFGKMNENEYDFTMIFTVEIGVGWCGLQKISETGEVECFMTVAGKVGLTGREAPISERRRQTSPSSPYSMLLSKAIVAAFTYYSVMVLSV